MPNNPPRYRERYQRNSHSAKNFNKDYRGKKH